MFPFCLKTVALCQTNICCFIVYLSPFALILDVLLFFLWSYSHLKGFLSNWPACKKQALNTFHLSTVSLFFFSWPIFFEVMSFSSLYSFSSLCTNWPSYLFHSIWRKKTVRSPQKITVFDAGRKICRKKLNFTVRFCFCKSPLIEMKQNWLKWLFLNSTLFFLPTVSWKRIAERKTIRKSSTSTYSRTVG